MGSRQNDIDAGVDILSSRVDAKTKSVLLGTGDNGNERSDTDNVVSWQQCGYMSRASKPSRGKKSAQAVIVRRGDVDISICTRDTRGQELAEDLDYGETCVYAAGETGTAQARALFRASGACGLFTRQGNVAGGAGVVAQVKADGTIVLANAFGGLEIGTASAKLVFGASSIELTASGIAFSGALADLATILVKLGAGAAAPVLWGPTGVAGAASTAVTVAAVPGATATPTLPSNAIPE